MTEIMTSPGVQGYDPRTAAPAGEPVPVTRSEEIEATVGRAAKAPPAWGDWPARRRAEALERIAAAVENAADELVASADLETALGRARLHGEFARTTGQLRLFADVLRDGNYVDAVIRRQTRHWPVRTSAGCCGRWARAWCSQRATSRSLSLFSAATRHRPRGRLPGRRQGTRGAPADICPDIQHRARGAR